MSSLRCCGTASPDSVRNEPRKPAPKPQPDTAVPTYSNAGTSVMTDATVMSTPVPSSAQPSSITRRGGQLCTTIPVTQPRPHNRKMTVPPTIALRECSSFNASDGPSDRYRPHSAQTATSTGTVARNARRNGRSTPTREPNRARRRLATVSGSRPSANPIRATNPASSNPYTSLVGAGAYRTSAADPSAPNASPAAGTAALTSAASPGRPVGCRSTSAAATAAVTIPVANPCVSRAAYSHSTLLANMNNTIATHCTTSAMAMTGRRPSASESDPVSSIAAISVSA